LNHSTTAKSSDFKKLLSGSYRQYELTQRMEKRRLYKKDLTEKRLRRDKESRNEMEESMPSQLWEAQNPRYAEIISPDSWELQGSNYDQFDDVCSKLRDIFKDSDDLISVTESVILFASLLNNSKTKSQIAIAILSFIKFMYPEQSLLLGSFEILREIAEIFLDKQSDFETQSLDFEKDLNIFDNIREIINKIFSSITEVECVRRACDIVAILSMKYTLKFKDHFLVQMFFNFAKDRKKDINVNESNIIMYIVDSILLICSRLYSCFKTKSFTPLFGSETTFSAWNKEVDILLRESKRQVDPLLATMDKDLFQNRVDTCQASGRLLYKNLPSGCYQRKIMITLLKDLEGVKFNLEAEEVVMKEREAPFCTLIYGSSGICKTQLMDLMYVQYAHTFNKLIGSHYKYNVNIRQKHFDGFKSSMWCAIIDDVSSEKSSKVMEIPRSLDTIFRLCNNLPVITEQAEAEKKGKIAFRSECIIVSTNVKHLDVAYYFNNQAAALRRLPWVVTVTPKPELSKDGMLDKTKLNTHFVEGERPDYWNFRVEKVKACKLDQATNTQSYEHEFMYEFTNIYDYLAWYSQAAIQHRNEQRAVTNIQEGLYTCNDLCKTCYKPSKHCSCVQWEPECFDEVKFKCCEWFDICRTWILIQSTMFLLTFFPNLWEWLIFCFKDKKNKTTFLKYVFQALDRDFIKLLHLNSENYNRFKTIFKCLSLLSVGYWVGKKCSKDSTQLNYSMSNTQEIRIKEQSVCEDPIKKTSSSKLTTEGAEISTGRKPTPLTKEKPRCEDWYYNNNVFLQPAVDISSASVSNQNTEKIIRQIKNNVIVTKFISPSGSDYFINWLCLGGDVYVTNLHTIKEDMNEHSFELLQNFSSTDGVSNNVKNCIFYMKMLRVDSTHDLCYYRFKQIPPKANIFKYIPLKDLNVHLYGILYLKREDREINCNYTFSIVNTPLETLELPVYTGVLSDSTKKGDCGNPVFAKTARGLVLLGIHSLGSVTKMNVGCCTAFTQERLSIIRDWIDKIVEPSIPQLTKPEIELNNFLREKSHIRYIPQGHCNVYGSFPLSGKNRPSKACKTFMYDSAIKYGFKDIGGAPCMTSWEPWNIALSAMVKTNTGLNEVILEKCIQSYTADILNEIPIDDIKHMVHVYDIKTTINGLPGITYVDGIKRSTSAGFPWNCSKRQFLIPDVSEEYPEGVTFTEDIMNRIKLCEDTYKQGKRYSPIFKAHLKDEVLMAEKAALKKTRVFCGAPVDFAMVQRKYLMGFMRLLKNHKFAFGCAIGINATSKEWNQIVYELQKVSPGLKHLFAGDYSKYDKTMSAALILGAFEVVINVCTVGGFSLEEVKVLRAIAYDIAYSWCEFDGTLIEFFGTNPSGHIFTVEINSIVGDLLLRYAYYNANPNKECETYSQNVKRVIYGDDNLVAVGRKARSWFNHTIMAEQMSKIGITYTMADKNSASRAFSDISQVTFLKRTFTYDDELKSYVAILDENSIHKCMTRWIPSTINIPEEQCLSTIGSVMREYFLHGREIFNQKREILSNIIKECHIEHMMEDWVLPQYDELKIKFEDYELV